MISATVKLSMLERAFNTLRRPDLRPAWKEARQPLRADIASHRNQQRGPDGGWPPRASSTRDRSASKRKSRPSKILGKLPTALQTKSDRRRVALISRVKWSKIHQEGGVAGHGARIPARPFLWASKVVLEVVGSIVSKHLGRLWRKAR